MTNAAPFDVEEFWDDLLAFVEDGRVLPVIGPSLLVIEDGGETVPLYAAVARRLLKKYGVAEQPASSETALHGRRNELNDAVARIAERGRRVRDLYRPIHDIIDEIMEANPRSLPILRELAAITHFDLFATTTPDRLLARALNVARNAGAEKTQEIVYAPKLSTERRHDMPATPAPGYTGVLYLFGRADVQPLYAIHDEDMLEFAYMLPRASGHERFFSQLIGRNLLFIGCNFSEWLNRFFIRMSNSDRLSHEDRSSELLVDQELREDGSLTVFLRQFSHNSRCLSADPSEFVSELVRRWKIRNPSVSATGETRQREALSPAMPTSAGTVFISYASEDAAAAQALFAALGEMGADVAWYDKSVLQPGDDWNEQITGAIQRCGIFLPVISANTERREEGYFRLEWREAAERTRRIQGRKFIFPVVVDRAFAGMEQYRLVPESFRAVQYSHAPAGEMPVLLKDELQKTLRDFRRARST